MKEGIKNPNYRHGLRYTKEYDQWRSMKQRCKKTYKNRIKVYKGWIDNPAVFINYIKSLENYNVENYYTLDRIENDGNYEPGNLRWTNNHVQQVNKRKYATNSSGYVGVIYMKDRNKYKSKIVLNNKHIHLGFFNTKEEAVIARNDYIIQKGLSEYKIQDII